MLQETTGANAAFFDGDKPIKLVHNWDEQCLPYCVNNILDEQCICYWVYTGHEFWHYANAICASFVVSHTLWGNVLSLFMRKRKKKCVAACFGAYLCGNACSPMCWCALYSSWFLMSVLHLRGTRLVRGSLRTQVCVSVLMLLLIKCITCHSARFLLTMKYSVAMRTHALSHRH